MQIIRGERKTVNRKNIRSRFDQFRFECYRKDWWKGSHCLEGVSCQNAMTHDSWFLENLKIPILSYDRFRDIILFQKTYAIVNIACCMILKMQNVYEKSKRVERKTWNEWPVKSTYENVSRFYMWYIYSCKPILGHQTAWPQHGTRCTDWQHWPS